MDRVSGEGESHVGISLGLRPRTDLAAECRARLRRSMSSSRLGGVGGSGAGVHPCGVVVLRAPAAAVTWRTRILGSESRDVR